MMFKIIPFKFSKNNQKQWSRTKIALLSLLMFDAVTASSSSSSSSESASLSSRLSNSEREPPTPETFDYYVDFCEGIQAVLAEECHLNTWKVMEAKFKECFGGNALFIGDGEDLLERVGLYKNELIENGEDGDQEGKEMLMRDVERLIASTRTFRKCNEKRLEEQIEEIKAVNEPDEQRVETLQQELANLKAFGVEISDTVKLELKEGCPEVEQRICLYEKTKEFTFESTFDKYILYVRFCKNIQTMLLEGGCPDTLRKFENHEHAGEALLKRVTDYTDRHQNGVWKEMLKRDVERFIACAKTFRKHPEYDHFLDRDFNRDLEAQILKFTRYCPSIERRICYYGEKKSFTFESSQQNKAELKADMSDQIIIM